MKDKIPYCVKNVSHLMRKPIFVVSDQIQQTMGCKTTEDNVNILKF